MEWREMMASMEKITRETQQEILKRKALKMREIKFRGKYNLDGDWIYGDLQRDSENNFYITQHTREGLTFDVEPKTVGQYTGIKDKNGTEIYEGDIVLVKAEGYESIISEVTWGGIEYPAFDLPNYDGDTMNGFSSIYHSEPKETIEVIGNIYENPELLASK